MLSDQRKQFIIDCVERYRKKYKKEFQLHVKAVNNIRQGRLNKYGADKAMEIRWGVSIPSKLFRQLDFLNEPRFLEDKEEFQWFMKTFKEFRIPEKI